MRIKLWMFTRIIVRRKCGQIFQLFSPSRITGARENWFNTMPESSSGSSDEN